MSFCPGCDSEMRREHEHDHCTHCGYLEPCCEGAALPLGPFLGLTPAEYDAMIAELERSPKIVPELAEALQRALERRD